MENNNVLGKNKKNLKGISSKSINKLSNVMGDMKEDILEKKDIVSKNDGTSFSKKIKEGVISVGSKVKKKTDHLIDNREQILDDTMNQLGDMAIKTKDGSEKVIKATSRTAIKAKDEVVGAVLSHLMILSKRIVSALKDILSPDGYSIMQNGGEFNDIGHYHLRIFPRYKGDGFSWLYGSDNMVDAIDIAIELRNRI